MFAQYDREATQIVDSIIELTYFMRGAIQYDTMFEMTFFERQRVESFIKKRLDQEKKNPSPVY